jgi:hypothetical protein
MDDMLTTEYDGCGRCLVGVRRLSRKTDATSSPQRQGDQIFFNSAFFLCCWLSGFAARSAPAARRAQARTGGLQGEAFTRTRDPLT